MLSREQGVVSRCLSASPSKATSHIVTPTCICCVWFCAVLVGCPASEGSAPAGQPCPPVEHMMTGRQASAHVIRAACRQTPLGVTSSAWAGACMRSALQASSGADQPAQCGQHNSAVTLQGRYPASCAIVLMLCSCSAACPPVQCAACSRASCTTCWRCAWPS